MIETGWATRLASRFDDEAGYRRNPVGWMRAKPHEEPWSTQREILDSIVVNRSTAVPSCHGPGKSFIAARAMAWWLDVHPVGTAFVLSTAPTAAQVSAILWRELGRVHTKAKLKGRINHSGYPQWYIGNELPRYRTRQESAPGRVRALHKSDPYHRSLFDASPARSTVAA